MLPVVSEEEACEDFLGWALNDRRTKSMLSRHVRLAQSGHSQVTEYHVLSIAIATKRQQ